MDQERSNDTTGNSNSDDTKCGAHSAEPPPAQQHDPAKYHGLTVQSGGRNPMAETAELIGKAAGTAQRQMRRGLELVRPITAPTAGKISSYSGSSGHHRSGQGNALEKERVELAAGMISSIEDELATARHEAAHRFGELSEFAAEQLLEVRERIEDAIARSRKVAGNHPVQTLAALAGFCFAFGLTLRHGGSRRR